MKKCLFAILLTFLGANYCFAAGNKEAKRQKKIIAKEEHHYQKEHRRDPQGAMPYLRHADNLAIYKQDNEKVIYFYKLALSADSANSAVYKDYGKYLFEKLQSIDEAKEMFTKGLSLAGNDDQLKKYMESVNKIIEKRDADNKLRDFGKVHIRELSAASDYKSISNIDSLKLITADPGNAYNYQQLLERFLADDESLTPQEMYMMIIGYSQQKVYSPFNYNDIYELRILASRDLDTAINRGIELTHSNPLNPSLYRELMYFHRKKDEQALADKYMHRIQQYFNGVLYSGKGSCDRPYISLWAKEEYNFITYLGYKSADSHSMGNCAGQMAEIIDVTDPNTHAADKINFNVKLIYLQATGK